MNENIAMITIDGFAPALLSAIRQLMEAPSWTDYHMLVYGILKEEGSDQAESANRLKSFLPRYPKIADFHNALVDLTNTQSFEEIGRAGYVAIPYVEVVDEVIPEWVKEEFEQLQARFVTILPQTEPLQQASDEIPNTMDDISQSMQGINLTIHEYPTALSVDNANRTLSNARVTAEVMEDMEMDAWDTEPDPKPDEELDWMDAALDELDQMKSELDVTEIEPSARQARAEAVEYLEKQNAFAVAAQKEVDVISQSMTDVSLN